MAIAFDNSAMTTIGASGGAYTVNITVGSVPNRVLAVYVQWSPGIATPTVTYSGTSDSITQIKANLATTPGPDTWMYLIVNPQTGAQTVTVTPNVNVGSRGAIVGSYNGVNQSSTPDNSGSANNGATTSFTQSLTVNTSNSWMVWGITPSNQGANDITAGANTLVRQNDHTVIGTDFADTNSTQAAGSQSMNVTSGSQAFAGIIMSLAPAVAVTTPTYGMNFGLSGVGT